MRRAYCVPRDLNPRVSTSPSRLPRFTSSCMQIGISQLNIALRSMIMSRKPGSLYDHLPSGIGVRKSNEVHHGLFVYKRKYATQNWGRYIGSGPKHLSHDISRHPWSTCCSFYWWWLVQSRNPAQIIGASSGRVCVQAVAVLSVMKRPAIQAQQTSRLGKRLYLR